MSSNAYNHIYLKRLSQEIDILKENLEEWKIDYKILTNPEEKEKQYYQNSTYSYNKIVNMNHQKCKENFLNNS